MLSKRRDSDKEYSHNRSLRNYFVSAHRGWIHSGARPAGANRAILCRRGPLHGNGAGGQRRSGDSQQKAMARQIWNGILPTRRRPNSGWGRSPGSSPPPAFYCSRSARSSRSTIRSILRVFRISGPFRIMQRRRRALSAREARAAFDEKPSCEYPARTP